MPWVSTVLPISIHALRKESDQLGRERCQERVISIHALRKESDFHIAGLAAHTADFNPRSP